MCYCAGVGEDTQLDETLMDLGHQVFAFDPTPRVIAHASTVVAERPEYHFVPIGLWDTDTVLRFHAPANPAHVSHSALNLQNTDSYFEAEVRTVGSLMNELGHEHVDLVKLDIEGAEHRVAQDLINSGIRPGVLCVEFDQPVPLRQCLATVGFLRRSGYAPVAVRDWNVTFVEETGGEPVGSPRS